MGTDCRVEEWLREKLALLGQELSETLAALDAVRADLAASEKARKEAEERLTLKRREYDIEVEVHAATKRERDSYIKGYEAAESRAARLAHAGAEFASQYGASAFDCRYDNSCDDSGREPRCEPCELRAAIAAEEGK